MNNEKIAGTAFDMTTVDEWAKEIKDGLSKLAPFVQMNVSSLGGDKNVSLYLLVSLDERDTWANHILENSTYFRMSLSNDGILEHFSGNTNRINFRKSRVKSAKDVVDKVGRFIQEVNKGREMTGSMLVASELVKVAKDMIGRFDSTGVAYSLEKAMEPQAYNKFVSEVDREINYFKTQSERNMDEAIKQFTVKYPMFDVVVGSLVADNFWGGNNLRVTSRGDAFPYEYRVYKNVSLSGEKGSIDSKLKLDFEGTKYGAKITNKDMQVFTVPEILQYLEGWVKTDRALQRILNIDNIVDMRDVYDFMRKQNTNWSWTVYKDSVHGEKRSDNSVEEADPNDIKEANRLIDVAHAKYGKKLAYRKSVDEEWVSITIEL